MDNGQSLIDHINKYVPIAEEDTKKILFHFRSVNLRRKENLMEAGTICRHHHFVVKGCVRMFFINDKGNEQTSQFAIENWWITDHLSFMKEKETDFFIQAVEPSEVLSIDRVEQEKLLTSYPKLERYFRLMYQIAYGAAQRGTKYRHDFSGEELYLHFSRGYPDFVNRVPQYLVASFLGITPEYLSEIRKKQKDYREH